MGFFCLIHQKIFNMYKYCLTILCSLFLAIQTNAQIGGEGEVYLDGDYVDAKFNGGGIQDFYNFVNKNIDKTKITKLGNLVFSFKVNEIGEIKNIRIIEFPEIEIAKEVIRVLKLAPNWEPAKKGGKPISIDIKFPISFLKTTPVLGQNEETKILKDTILPNNNYGAKNFESNEIETAPKFPGGLKVFYEFVNSNFKVPSFSVKGKILLDFIIDIDGSVIDIKVIKDVGYGTGKEAVRVMRLCPKWIPGYQLGKPVRVKYMIPINLNVKVE